MWDFTAHFVQVFIFADSGGLYIQVESVLIFTYHGELYSIVVFSTGYRLDLKALMYYSVLEGQNDVNWINVNSNL